MDAALPITQNPAQAVGKGFGIRAGAYILDTIVIALTNMAVPFVIGFLIGLFFALITGRTPAFAEQGDQCLNYLTGFLSMTLYFTLFEWLYGATPGKLILGMRVVQENGNPCNFFSAFTRALLRLIDGLFFGVPAYMSMKAPLYQRFGDRHAKTIVVSSKDAVIQKAKPGWGFLIAAVCYLLSVSLYTMLWILAMLQ